jgi:hypothetical protein
MTREEAIKVLNTYDVNFYEYTAEEIVEAIDMAVKALQAEPVRHGKLNNLDDSLLTTDPEACKEQKSKLDLISRQAAIDALQGRK